MTHEDYVSFEQAKTLKELGFDWECYCAFDKVYRKPDPEGWELRCYHTPQNHNLASYSCSAPTLAQAQKWLRKVKEICVTSSINIRGGKYKFNWSITLFKEGRGIWDESVIYDTYEQALSAGIDKALEILKEENNG